MFKFEPGQILRFTYTAPPEARDKFSGPPFKEIFVLHPGWLGKVHGIDLKRLTQAERDVLRALFDKRTTRWVKKGKPHKYPLVNDVLKRMDPIEEIKNPVAFYNSFVKVFLRNKDAYRTYYPTRMSGVSVVKGTDVAGRPINPNPLFKKPQVTKDPQQPPPAKPVPTQQPKPPESPAPMSAKDRLELIKKRAQALRDKNKK